jgi:hypothetical protein
MGKARRTKRQRQARQVERDRLRAKRHDEGPRPQGTWGGRRVGAGRPRLHASNAERQAAYRRRLVRRAPGGDGKVGAAPISPGQ